MTFAFDPTETFEHICTADRELPEGDPGRTVWTLRGLTVEQRRRLQDNMVSGRSKKGSGTTMDVQSGTMELELLRCGLVGVTNFNRRNPAFTDEHRRAIAAYEAESRMDFAEGEPRPAAPEAPPRFVPVPFDTERNAQGREQVSLEFLNRIPASVRSELADAIDQRGGELSEDTAGKS